MSLAKVTIVGNLGRDPETRYTPNGQMNLNFSVAVGRRWVDATGNQQEWTNWYRVTAWARLAESLDKLVQQGALVKGRQVIVVGDLQVRDYVGNDGQSRYSLDVRADTVQLAGSREGSGEFGGPVGGGRPGDSAPDEGSFDDVPF